MKKKTNTILCFDMGGTDLKYGVISDGEFLFKDKEPTLCHETVEVLINQYIRITKEMLKKFPDISGVGIGVAGTVDINKAVIVIPPLTIPVFKNFDFRKLFKENFDLDCYADNDVNTFAMSEINVVPYRNFVMMTVGTGIGGAIIIDGKLWHGVNFNGGEIGRMLIDDRRYELHASMSSLISLAISEGVNIKNGIELFKLYDQGDAHVVKMIDHYYDELARGVANIVYIINPEAIIIGGGIANRNTFVEELTPHVNKFLTEGFQDATKIRRATYQNDGGLMGAYNNFIHERDK